MRLTMQYALAGGSLDNGGPLLCRQHLHRFKVCQGAQDSVACSHHPRRLALSVSVPPATRPALFD